MNKKLRKYLNKVIYCDNRKLLKKLPKNSIDAIVTDPPYEINFMSKEWDSMGISFNSKFWKKCFRVLKPGAYILVFGGARTSHRITCAIEDAGFLIRDVIMFGYGSGFPKSHNVNKSISKVRNEKEARQWDGWGTALKPAYEPIILAQKSKSEKNIALNVLKWGTGGINIDACRVNKKSIQGRWPANLILECCCNELLIGNEKGRAKITGRGWGGAEVYGRKGGYGLDILGKPKKKTYSYQGRTYNVKGFVKKCKPQAPSNYGNSESFLIHTNPECPCFIVDRQSGNKKGWSSQKHSAFNPYGGNSLLKSKTKRKGKYSGFNDSGGASRFFKIIANDRIKYGSKVSTKERMGAKHPTMKSMELISYLIKLITPRDGVILDPFAGTFTTALAAEDQFKNWICCDFVKDYCRMGKKRLETYFDSSFKVKVYKLR